MRSSSPGMSIIQKVLTLLLVGLIGYVGYNHFFPGKDVVKEIEKIVKTIK